jgi:hypothetical protein
MSKKNFVGSWMICLGLTAKRGTQIIGEMPTLNSGEPSTHKKENIC